MSEPASPEPQALPAAGLPRRLGAILYDWLVLLALLIIATMVARLLMRWLATDDVIDPGHPVGHALFQLYLLAVVFGFYGWFWTHGGQTLGMRAWRIRLQRADGAPVTWPRALARFAVVVVLLGAGVLALSATGGPPTLDTAVTRFPLALTPLAASFLWAAVDRRGRTWHDFASGSVVVRVP